MALSKNHKLIIAAVGTAVAITGAAIIVSKIKKGSWSGKLDKKDKDHKFNPDKQRKVAYLAKGKNYANVRSSAKLPQETYFDKASQVISLFGWITSFGQTATPTAIDTSNLIGKVYSQKIGTVLSESKGDRGFIWFKVKLAKTLNGKQYGYVRQDVAHIKIEDK